VVLVHADSYRPQHPTPAPFEGLPIHAFWVSNNYGFVHLLRNNDFDHNFYLGVLTNLLLATSDVWK